MFMSHDNKEYIVLRVTSCIGRYYTLKVLTAHIINYIF